MSAGNVTTDADGWGNYAVDVTVRVAVDRRRVRDGETPEGLARAFLREALAKKRGTYTNWQLRYLNVVHIEGEEES